MEFDYDKLKELLTDELYNTYEMDLEVLKTKNPKNIMKDFELVNIKMISLEESNVYIPLYKPKKDKKENICQR